MTAWNLFEKHVDVLGIGDKLKICSEKRLDSFGIAIGVNDIKQVDNPDDVINSPIVDRDTREARFRCEV